MIAKTTENESRTDRPDRVVERKTTEGRILFPFIQRTADSAAHPYQMERYTSTKGGKGEVCEDMGEEEWGSGERLMVNGYW